MAMTNYEGTERRRTAWHLDRKVPIAFLFLLILEAGAFVWWAAELNSLARANAKTNQEQAARLDAFESRERDNGKLVERIVRVETIMESVLRTVNKIDDSMQYSKRNR